MADAKPCAKDFMMLRFVSRRFGSMTDANAAVCTADNVLFEDTTRSTHRLVIDAGAMPQPARVGLTPSGAALSVSLLLGCMAVHNHPTLAAEAVQTFGPGQVNCQALTGTKLDCMLSANRVTQDDRNVATFGVEDLPSGDQALFRRRCLAGANECTITITGRRSSPQSTRLSRILTLRWSGPSAPATGPAARIGPGPSQ